jgi:hypothetical protein
MAISHSRGTSALSLVELRVVEQPELVHHPGDEGPRPQELDLRRHRRPVRRQPAQHRLDVDDLALLRVDQDHRLGGVGRRQALAIEIGAHGAEQDEAADQQLAPPQRPEKAQDVDGVGPEPALFRLGRPPAHSRYRAHPVPTCQAEGDAPPAGARHSCRGI